MRFRWFKMGIEGKVAVANLGLVGLVLVALLITFPDGVIRVDETSEGMLAFLDAIEVALMVLTFPVGWFPQVFSGMLHHPPMTTVIFVPLNAYFWGYIVATLVRWRKSRRKPTCSADDPFARS